MKDSSKAPSLPPQAEAILQSLNDFVISPSTFILDQQHPVAITGFSYLHRATLSRPGVAEVLVAVKKRRFTQDATRRNQIYLRMLRQLKIWVQLRHPGILPLIGFHIDDARNEAWLVSPWQPNGNIMAYLSKHETRIADRLRLCVQVGEAVQYLHEQTPPIFHGDLKGSKVLVTESRTAVLAGFGLAEAMEDVGTGLTTSGGLTASIRWTSPELFTETIPHRSQWSDVWAFGCMLLEVLTGSTPFRECWTDVAVILQVTQGQLPAPPDSLVLAPSLRKLLERCWSRIPEGRPSIQQCLIILQDPSLYQDSQENAGSQRDVPLPLDDGALVSVVECSQGRFSDISKALWQRPNKPSIQVAVKKLIQRADGTKGLTVAESKGRWYRECERWARMWNSLEHHRILPILAFSQKPPPYVLSPWCEYGDLKSYLQVNPLLDFAAKMDLLIQVGEAVLGLHTHRPPVIHGNIHATNILVYAPGQIYLGGFSQARFLDEPDQHTSSGLTTGADEFSPSYIVPEVAKESPLTPATDVYSFASLILECVSGNPPFYNTTRSLAVLKILGCNELPAFTDHPELPASDPLWHLLRKSWDNDPSERPSLPDILSVLRERAGNNTRNTSATQPPSFAASPVLLDSSSLLLSGSAYQSGNDLLTMGQLEGKLVVNDDSPMYRGGFGDVYRGEWIAPDGRRQIVAAKHLRSISLHRDELDQADLMILATRVRREAFIWSQLLHRHIVPFLGVKFEDRPILVSKWYANGNLGDYLKGHPELSLLQRLDFVDQTAQALEYLHTRTIFHGDVKPNNVLLDEDMTVGLTDFGLSRLVVDAPNGLETGFGTKGYQAPELVRGLGNTLASDVYAFGSFTLSILSGEAPFYELNPQQTLLVVNEGRMPLRESHTLLKVDNPVWILLEQCWQPDPAKRPTMDQVVQSLLKFRDTLQSTV